MSFNESHFLQLLNKEALYYKTLLALTQEEHQKLLNKKPLNEIFSILKKKKVLLSCIDEIAIALQPLKQQWKEVQKQSDPDQNLTNSIELLNNIIKHLIELNQTNQQLFKKRHQLPIE